MENPMGHEMGEHHLGTWVWRFRFGSLGFGVQGEVRRVKG